jgi:hypothetical protein
MDRDCMFLCVKDADVCFGDGWSSPTVCSNFHSHVTHAKLFPLSLGF